MIGSDMQSDILRLFHAERWKVGTIANQLGIHHSVVTRVLLQAGVAKPLTTRPSILDPYIPFINKTLEKYPKLPASRLYDMAVERGYEGGPSYFRHLISRLRPRKPAEAYLRLRTLPGEEAQVDWGHFGHLQIGRAKRALMGFVMVLSYSRKTFLRFYLDAQMPNFIRGHVEAFEQLGIARVLLYDNLKSAVLERRGDAIRYNPKLLELAGYYHFKPQPVAVARGNEKGRVERKIRHIRTNFFAARDFKDIDDLNAQADVWCNGLAAKRPCPEDVRRSVEEVYEEERPKLLAHPEESFEATEKLDVSVRKAPYARFDLNDYSVPHTSANRILTIVADLKTVRIFDAAEEVATHERTFDKGSQIETPGHIDALREEKRKSKKASAMDHLQRAVPSTKELLLRAAERGTSLGMLTARLRKYLGLYGAQALDEAVTEALELGTLHIGGIGQLLEQNRRKRGLPPPVAIDLSQDPRIRDLVVSPHSLKSYDQLSQQKKEETDDDI